MPRFYDHEDVEAGWAGAGGEEGAPLVNSRADGYTNPYVNQEDIDAAMQDDNVSVLSGGADPALQHQTDETLKKSPGVGEGASLADAKKAAGEVLKKDEASDSSWYMAPLVVVLFISFDTGKFLAEKAAIHGSTINSSMTANVIQVLNLVLAFTLTMIFMGPKEGLSAMFEWKKLSAYALPSAMFSLSQVMNLVQNIYITGATRKVFSQLRIPLTALFSMIVMGAGYSTLQWMMIFAITCSVFQFQMLQEPTDLFDSTDVIIGLVLSIMTNVCAVLGSLFGEKIMKDSKKLPFYLQKFQFEVWTLLFGLGGTFGFVPLVAMVLDLCDGHNESVVTGPQFVKNWPLSYRAAVYSSKEALTNWKYEAKFSKYVESDGALTEKAGTMTIPNRMDMAYWTTQSDMRSAGTQYGVELGSTPETFNSYEQFNKLHRIMAKRRSKTSGELKTVEDRTLFVNRGLAKDFGRMPGHSPDQLRKVAGSEALVVDTKFYMGQPFTVSTPTKPKFELTDNFVMTLGPKPKDDNTKFEPLSFFKRDTPQGDAEVMKKSLVTGHFASGANKNTGLPKPSAYFTLTQDYSIESAQDIINLARELRPTTGLDAPKPEYLPELKKLIGKYFEAAEFDAQLDSLQATLADAQNALAAAEEKVRKAKETLAGDEDNETKKQEVAQAEQAVSRAKQTVEQAEKPVPDAQQQQQARKAAADAEFNGNAVRPFTVSQKFEYKKAQYYVGDITEVPASPLEKTKNTLLIAYIRTTTLTLEALNKDDANQATSFSKSVDERVTFKVSECQGALDFEDEDFVAKQTDCKKLEPVSDVKPGKFSLAFAANKPASDADPKVSEGRNEKKKKEKEEKAGWAEKSADDQKKALKEGWEKTLLGDVNSSPLATRDLGLPFFSKLALGTTDDLLKTNEYTMFQQPVDKAIKAIKELPAAQLIEVQTYPGSEAGAAGSGCTAAMCNVTGDEWTDNFEYFRSMILGSRSFRKMRTEHIDLSQAENMQYERYSFRFAELHGYTVSPLPSAFITVSFFVAIFLNAGQTWMSAYIAKVLSSLWKNICAAISLVLIVLLEKIFLEDSIKAQSNDWARIVFGMVGVILTVLVFQMSPKDKKH
eukprot:g12784.t1